MKSQRVGLLMSLDTMLGVYRTNKKTSLYHSNGGAIKNKHMKKNSFLRGVLPLLFMGVLFTGCFKKFDPDSYKPKFSAGGFTSSRDIKPANLVGYWAFNGSMIDSVTGTAAVPTGVGYANGFKGQAMKGADKGYAIFTPSARIRNLQSFTITYWMNSPVNTSGIVGLVNLANTSEFWGNINSFIENGSTAASGRFRVNLRSGTNDVWLARDGIVDFFDKWVSIGISYNAANKTATLYLNGSVLVRTVATNFAGPINFLNVGNLVFGAVHFQTTPSQTSATGSQGWASFLTGLLDEVRFYDAALTDEEMDALVKLEGKGK